MEETTPFSIISAGDDSSHSRGRDSAANSVSRRSLHSHSESEEGVGSKSEKVNEKNTSAHAKEIHEDEQLSPQQIEAMQEQLQGGHQIRRKRLLTREKEINKENEVQSYYSNQEDPVNSKQPRRIRLYELLLLNTFTFSFSFSAATLFLIVLPKESTFLFPETPAEGLSTLLAFSGVTQLITPISGYLSDRTRQNVCGKRIPWIFGGCLAMIASLIIMGLLREENIKSTDSNYKERIKYVQSVYVVVFVAFNIVGNIAYSAFNGLLPDIVPESQTGEASGVLALCGSVGALSGVLTVSFALKESKHSYYVFAIVIAVSTVSCCVTALRILWSNQGIHHSRIANESEEIDLEQKRLRETDNVSGIEFDSYLDNEEIGIDSAISMEKISPSNDFNPISIQEQPLGIVTESKSRCSSLKIFSKDFAWVWVSRLLFYLSTSTQAWLLYFIRDVILPNEKDAKTTPEELTAAVLIVGMISSAVVAGPCGSLSDRIGRKVLVYLSCFLMAFVNTWWARSNLIWEVVLGSVFYGIATGCFLSVDLALAIETIEKEVAAQALGVWGIAAFFGATMGPAISGPLLSYFGSTTVLSGSGGAVLPELNASTHGLSNGTISSHVQYERAGYVAVLIVAGIATLLSGIAIFFVRKVR